MGLVCLGAHAFFSPVAGDSLNESPLGDMLDACIDLALVYKCDPFSFFDRPEHQIAELYRRTMKRLRETGNEG